MRDCLLCRETGGTLVWSNPLLRVIDADDPVYPGTMRVVLNRHVTEMTDLAEADQQQVMRATFCVERTMRDVLNPDKINLAALGNMVAHVHWHIIPRWKDDPHFPQAIWAALPEVSERVRQAQHARQATVVAARDKFHAVLTEALARTIPGSGEG